MSDTKSKRLEKAICVIGGSGFIGTRLCKRLASAKLEFCILDKSQSTSFPEKHHFADVRSVDQLRQKIPVGSVIINLAAEHRDDVRPRSLYDDVNVQGARNICQVAEEKGVTQILFTSSVAVYGFAPPHTDERGAINPFNDYGRTKYEAEQVLREWQMNDPDVRSLVIIRPTVVFGEQNRGNVYNLLRQIASGRFVMIGAGTNFKSMAYVENVAAFIEHAAGFGPGVHVYNYIDKPDFNMNLLVSTVREKLGKAGGVGFRLPYSMGYCVGLLCDLAARITGKSFPISSIRVKKFAATTQFDTTLSETKFLAPVPIKVGLERTVQYEFLESHSNETVFFTE
jgi:nucleoside-diphosphate-sugar epimerase